MGCMYACTCSGRCYDCSEYQREEYIGHAEDILAQANGYGTAEEWQRENEQTLVDFPTDKEIKKFRNSEE